MQDIHVTCKMRIRFKNSPVEKKPYSTSYLVSSTKSIPLEEQPKVGQYSSLE